MKIVTVLGARPQFIKAATISRAISDHNKLNNSDRIDEVIVHTGQHFDGNMSEIFFDELDIPRPQYKLEISGLNHGAMTGRMLESVEKILTEEVPDCVLVYGDTNSTLAGALAAAKLGIHICHVEAGLRSFNSAMPEEINRILTDRMSSLLFVPSENPLTQLKAEGFPYQIDGANGSVTQSIINSGDVMYDAVKHYSANPTALSALNKFDLNSKEFVLSTIHRQENTDDAENLVSILHGLIGVSEFAEVLLPLHPRTRKKISGLDNFKLNDRQVIFNGHAVERIRIVEPVSYLEMQGLESGAKAIITDSGGVQKEAYFHGVPCITLREETEWVETIEGGWNTLVGHDSEKIVNAFYGLESLIERDSLVYGDGDAARKILSKLVDFCESL